MKKLLNMFQVFKSMKGDENSPTSKRKFNKNSVFSDDDLRLPKRTKRLSSTNDRNPATSSKRKLRGKKRFSSINDINPATSKRKCSDDSVSSDDDLRLPKRTKRLSSTNDRNPATNSKRKLRQSKRLVPKRASSTNIHDIPEELLVEILCRLPCAKSVLRCKCVSKSWCSLTSDPNFIGRFIWLQRHNQTLIPGTIINRLGHELLTTDLFAKFQKIRKEMNLEVLATWNDLVLCKSESYKDDGQYYICNPRTMRFKDQLVTLPPSYQSGMIAVGFICEPYYKEEEDNITDQKEEQEKRKVIRVDTKYKFKVVRILPPAETDNVCLKFKVQVFSNDIGEWRESLVSCPGGFVYSKIPPNVLASRSAFASNGMLYWNTTDGDLLGLGPLIINNKSTIAYPVSPASDDDSRYQFHVIKLNDRQEDEDERSSLYYHLQSHRGSLQLVRMVANENGIGARLFVWDLEKEEQEKMALQGGGELGKKHRNIYSIMDGVRCYDYSLEYNIMQYFGSDPNDLNTCFVSLTDSSIYRCNIQERERYKMKMDEPFDGKAFQIMLPWWPTPLPTIRSHTAETRDLKIQ